jgi:hypothetical protein
LDQVEFRKDILIWIESTITEGKLHRFNATVPEDPADPNPVISRNKNLSSTLKK